MKYFFIIAVFFSLIIPQPAHAVVPPDFIIQVSSQIIPIFGTIFAMAIAGFSILYNYIGAAMKKKYFIIAGVILLLGGISLLVAYQIDTQRKNREIAEIQELIAMQEQQYQDEQNNKKTLREDIDPALESDKETLLEDIDPALESDIGAQIIRSYYSYISEGNLLEAYRLTQQRVTFDTFYSWYKDTTFIHIDKLESTGEDTYSVRVVLYEDEEITTFAVLVEMFVDENEAIVGIESTEVAVLGTGATLADDSNIQSISNDGFTQLINTNANPFVLDARELIEYEYGRFPGSTHIKFADLEAGRWQELPTDEPIYVLCWSGIRGSLVASFLQEQGLNAYYLEDGANGWVKNGGIWDGEISFSAVYTQEQYNRVFTKSQFEDYVKQGAFLVDARTPAKFEENHIEGSLNIRVLHTPTEEMDQMFSQIPESSNVIVLCDDYVNCFDARITGIELERRNHTFLGRYIYTTE